MPKKKTRTLSSEQIKKMQDGRKRKQMLKNREESIKNLEHRLYIGSHNKKTTLYSVVFLLYKIQIYYSDKIILVSIITIT